MDELTTADEELFEAVQHWSSFEVRNLLRRTANITTKNKDGDTVLHLAATADQEPVVQELIKADKWKEIVNAKDALGGTALHNCALSGCEGITTLLLQNGADATATDQDGWTALHHAAGLGHLAIVKCLVKHMMENKMDCNQKTNKSGVTALHIAADRGYAKIVDELMSNGPRNTTTAWDGRTVLHWALQGAIWAGHDLSSEDKTGDESSGIDLHDEAVDFDDDGGGINRLSEYFGSEDTAEKHDAVFKRILSGLDGATKWSELLKVARREERRGALQYLMREMYPKQVAERLQRPLRRIWLAMSETRTQELMEMLWAEAREARKPELMEKLRKKRARELMERLRTETHEPRTQELMESFRTEAPEAITQELMERLRKEAQDNKESMEKWDSMGKWDVLSLATSLGKFQTVYWLLRSRRWSKSDIDNAKKLPDYDRLNENDRLSIDGEIWNTPFVHDERSGGENYRWLTADSNEPKFDRLRATIMDFHMVDNQIVSIYYECDISSLIHQGENHGPDDIVKKSMRSLEDQKTGGVVANEYSDKTRCYRWIHLAINSVSIIHS